MVKIVFVSGNNTLGEMESSLEAFDASNHTIPQYILENIKNSNNVQILFLIDNGGNEYE